MPRRKTAATNRSVRRTSLNGRWRLQGSGPHGEEIDIPARVPGVVHWDLERAKIIADPFKGANEDTVQWVALQNWTYSLSFRASPRMVESPHADLVFEGLDTVAEIALNGEPLGRTDNMFVAHRFDVKRRLESGENVLAVKFLSPIEEGLRLHRELNEVRLYEGEDNPRAYLRKAQYSFGWDWGPKVATSGIWRDAYVETWGAGRIESVFWRTVEAGPKSATVEVTVDAAGSPRCSAEAWLEAGGKRIAVELEKQARNGGTRFTGAATIRRALLWWPAGQGPQNLYTAGVTLSSGGRKIDSRTDEIGIRTVNLKRQEDEEGESFIIEVNGREIFSKGANWIPADSYLPRVTTKDYDQWVRLAAEANMNMLRVWGGGIYEPQAFYCACDRYGIMVWQDFPFACAMYPENKPFLRNVENEARLAVKALRNHPSIVLWCGNNENHWAARSWWPDDPFGGKTIYNKLLPKVLSRLDPSRPYWPGSPFGGKDPNSPHKGDRHSWDVWSNWRDYRHYLQDNGRFISEFGFQGCPPMETVEEFGPLRELHPQHPLFERHNKQVEGPERLVRFLAGTFRVPPELNRFVYLTQLVQAEAIKTGVLYWRSRMMKTAGALYWQLNDCWPVISWASVDYKRRPKALYYYTRRFFAPLAVRVAPSPQGIAAHVINDSPETVGGEVALQALSFDGAEAGCVREDITCGPRSVTQIGPFKAETLNIADPSRQFLAVTFKTADGRSIVDTAFLARPKQLHLGDPGLEWQVQGENGGLTVTLSTKGFAYGVCLRLPGTDARFSDNFLTMLPGATATVEILHSKLTPATAAKKLKVDWVRSGL